MLNSRVSVCATLVVLFIMLPGCSMTNGRAMNSLGQSQFKKGNYAQASRYFRMAAADDPDRADYVHNLASAMWKQGDTAGAEQLYRQSLEIDPMHQPSYHSLAKMLNETNRVEEAHSLLAMWGETQPYLAEPHVEMAWLNRETGNPAGAEESLRRALNVDPKNSTALAHLGQVYEDQGRSGEAVAMYRRSLHKDWRQPGVKRRIANLSQPQWQSTDPGTQLANQQFMAPAVIGTPQFATQQPVAPQFAAPQFATQQPLVVPGPVMATQPTGTHTALRPPMVTPQPTAPIVTLMPPEPAQSNGHFSQPVQLGAPLTQIAPGAVDQRITSLPVVDAL
jgi:Tfp pilus assembly protein PilF